MASIVISGNTYFSYASVADADLYLAVDPNAATWNALSADAKGTLLIQSTRFIDSLCFIDAVDTQAERELNPVFADATIMIAGLLSTGDNAILGGTAISGSTDAQSYKAGSVALTYFRNLDTLFPTAYSAWPNNIFNLLKPYLCSQNTGIGFAESFGTCGPWIYEDYGLINS